MLLKVIREKEIAYYNCQQIKEIIISHLYDCLLYTSPSPRD